MAFLLANLALLLFLLLLLLISGLFSGAETVLFSLSRHDRQRFKKSKNRLEVLAASLVENPRSLLTTLMIGNLGCNILTFVISALLLARLHRSFGAAGVGGEGGFLSLGHLVWVALLMVPPLLVTYVSDVFPKVVAALNNTRIAPIIALPVATLVRVFYPVSRALDLLVMRPVHRLVSGGRPASRRTGGFSTDELQELLEMSEEQGVIDVSENELLQEVVRLGEVRVRDVMRPRVDLVAYNLKDPPEKLLGLMRQSHLGKIPVYEGQIDNIVGLIYSKEVLLTEGKLEPRKLVQAAQFVSEFQTLDRLIVRFRQTKTQLAIVVDEYGGVLGLVTLEDVVEQMVGDIYEPHDTPSLATQKLSADEYRVAGDMSIVDWMEAFGTPSVEGDEGREKMDLGHTATVAGLLASLLKRIPKVGDEVRMGHLLMTVESMRGRRVDRVRLKLTNALIGDEGGTP